MTFSVKDMIIKRKSVRTFTGEPLKNEDRVAIEQFIQSQTNPFDVSVDFRFLDVKEYGLSSPVIVGADLYLAAKVKRCKHYEIGFGYSFEHVCLYAESLGVGTVMLAASLSRAAFEKAMDVQDDEVLPVASPVGYPSQKKSIRESLMRKGLKADKRIPFEQLFFDKQYGNKLSASSAGIFADALEMARWAPSAGNKQPWRAVVIGDTVHFYKEKSMRNSPLGDIQKVDVGIALAHFDLTMQEEGHKGRFVEADPSIAIPENVQYVISYEMEK
ncbi:nitroreductase family protein [uncultured Methanobrevibacter sp.]|mgnify:FL=1|uniref:nitroreductase family protein n=1 Tax=uncultured Methanobrevibacter sp. TaxID=253161 RepID=UPI00262BEE89|nr:nitroreductase family protein [uncultured Methanobrevibacter sp.]